MAPSIFALPELVAQIALYLTSHDIVQCIPTCRLLHYHLSPFLYRELTIQPSSQTHRDIWAQSLAPESSESTNPVEPVEEGPQEYILKCDDEVSATKQHAAETRSRWKENLRQVRTIAATCHVTSLLDILVSSLEEEDKQDLGSLKSGGFGSKRISRIHKLDLDYGHLNEERDIDTDWRVAGLQTRSLLELLHHSSCHLFLVELWLPCTLLNFHRWSGNATKEEELRQERRDFLQVVLKGELKQLSVIGIHKSAHHNHMDPILWIFLLDGLLRVQTLERIEYQFYDRVGPDQLVGMFLPATPAEPPSSIDPLPTLSRQPSRLRHLGLSEIQAPFDQLIVPILQNFGSSLERLDLPISVLLRSEMNLKSMVSEKCTKLQHLTLDHPPGAGFSMSGSSALSILLKSLRALRKRSQRSRVSDSGEISPKWSMITGETVDSHSDLYPRDCVSESDSDLDNDSDGDSNDKGRGSKGPGLVSLRILKIDDRDSCLTGLLDGHWETLEELRVDCLMERSPKAQLELILTRKSTSRLSTFSITCGPLGHLWMESLAYTFPSWSCSRGLRVLRLTVGRAQVDGDSETKKMVGKFYERIGQCHQLEELEVGYSSEQGIYFTRDKYRAVGKDTVPFLFWDLTLPLVPSLPLAPSSQSPPESPASQFRVSRLLSHWPRSSKDHTGSDVLSETEESGRCLHHLAELSKLRTLSLPRGNLWSRMGTREVEFMAEHWPMLQTIKIAVKDREQLQQYREKPHWQWLLRERWDFNLMKV